MNEENKENNGAGESVTDEELDAILKEFFEKRDSKAESQEIPSAPVAEEPTVKLQPQENKTYSEDELGMTRVIRTDELKNLEAAPTTSAVPVPDDEDDDLEKIFKRQDSEDRKAEKREKKAAEKKEQEEERAQEDAIEERDYRPIRFRRTSRLGCLGGIMYGAFVICVSIVLAVVAWMAASDLLALGKDGTEATVTIPADIFTPEEVETTDDDGNPVTKTVETADMDYVTTLLKDSGMIEYPWMFKLYANFSHAGQKIDPGTYSLKNTLDYRALIKNMQTGTASMLTTTVTFPEGYTMEQIFTKLEEEGVCSKEDLYAAAADVEYDYSFLEDTSTGDASRLEGFIFPNTYEFYQGEQASSVINKFLTALHYQITADMLKQENDLGITFRDAVNIASMIEKEAANDEERSLIASVIYNRLAAGMPLGIDSTILYVFPDFSGDEIPTDIINYDSPYNTRLYTGLPPTPICNPGIASIKAALQPAETDYLYYALDTATGTHQFFTNQNDFNAFVATQDYGANG